jgi:hypothetical protein
MQLLVKTNYTNYRMLSSYGMAVQRNSAAFDFVNEDVFSNNLSPLTLPFLFQCALARQHLLVS